MVKLKKRVAVNKISRFFKTTPLVIFFHCNNRSYFNEKVKNSSFFSNAAQQDILKPSMKEQDCSVNINQVDRFSIKNYITKEKLIIKLIKNSYAKKALFNNKRLTNKNNNDSLTFDTKTNKMSSLSLFQGNNLLIGFKNLNFLPSLVSLKDFIEDENIEILGGIYDNCVVDHNQIKRLAKISQDLETYKKLNSQLRNNSFNLINNIKGALDLTYLLNPHYRIIFLLKSLTSSISSIEHNKR